MLKITPAVKLLQAGHVEKAKDGAHRRTALRTGKNDDFILQWLNGSSWLLLYRTRTLCRRRCQDSQPGWFVLLPSMLLCLTSWMLGKLL